MPFSIPKFICSRAKKLSSKPIETTAQEPASLLREGSNKVGKPARVGQLQLVGAAPSKTQLPTQLKDAKGGLVIP